MSFLPNAVNVIHTHIDFACRLVGKIGIDDTLIETELASVRGDAEHIIHGSIIMIIVLLPFMLMAMYEKNGQPLEKIVRNIVQVCFLRPKQRPYKTNNFYSVLERQENLDKEVYRIVRKTKAHEGGEKANPSRHRKGEKAR